MAILTINNDRILPLKRVLISTLLLLVCLSFASHEANGQEERYWGTIVRHPPANYVLRMDNGKLLNAEWESGYHRWLIGQRIILTTENGSGYMFFNNKHRLLSSPIIPHKLEGRGSSASEPAFILRLKDSQGLNESLNNVRTLARVAKSVFRSEWSLENYF